MSIVRTVRTVAIEVTETISVAPVPFVVESAPMPAPALPFVPAVGNRVLYTGPKGTNTYKVFWVGTKKGSPALRVGLIGFGGRVKFFVPADRVRLA